MMYNFYDNPSIIIIIVLPCGLAPWNIVLASTCIAELHEQTHVLIQIIIQVIIMIIIVFADNCWASMLMV